METEDNNLFTFLSLRKVVGRTFGIYFSCWRLVTTLALIVVIPQIVVCSIWYRSLMLEDPETFIRESALDAVHFYFLPPLKIIASIFQVQFSFLFCVIVQAAIVQVVAEYYTQKRSTFRSSLVHAVDRFRDLFGFALLYTAEFLLLVMVAFAVLYLYSTTTHAIQYLAVAVGIVVIAFTLYALMSMAIALPVLMVEKKSPIDAVKRSFELLRANRCYVFCSILLLAIVLYFGYNLYQFAVQAIFGWTILGSVVSGLSAAVTFPFQTMYVPACGNRRLASKL